jgi:carboxylesterase type B
MRFSPVLIAAGGFSLTAGAHFGHDDLSVKTNGGTIHGRLDKATPAVRQFLSIPYARPPVNDLRFAPPQPALPFGELNANEFGPSCMRRSTVLFTPQHSPHAASEQPSRTTPDTP